MKHANILKSLALVITMAAGVGVTEADDGDNLRAPNKLTASGITFCSFTANWDAVDGAASYLLDVASFPFDEQEPDDPDNPEGGTHDKAPDVLSGQSVSGTSFTVEDLDFGTYYWRVRAVGQVPGPFSETEETTLVADPTAPPQISSIHDIAILSGETARVRVRVSAPEEAPVTSLSIVEGDPSAALSDDYWFSFTPELPGRYEFTIVAVNANGSASCQFAVVASVAPVPYSGQTTPGEYEISTPAQLRLLAEKSGEFDFACTTNTLLSDIDLGGTDWTPIGDDSTPFTGWFHGNGHTISGLVCTNNPSANSCRGLFGCVSNATIKCVSVSGLAAGKQYVGGLVGRARGGTVISNCVAVVEVTATGSYAGGLVGSCDGGDAPNRIIDCRADGFVGGNGFVGGFVGYVYAPVTITNCVARGDARSAGSDYGGFVGRFAHDSATIDDCWCSGAVWGTGGSIGSFIGNWASGTITNCAASAYANGLRLFCGSSTAITGDMLSLSEVHTRSAGWPSAPKRAKSSAMIPISTAEELRAVTNNLAGSYALMADIDLNGEGWTPIGDYNHAFTGEFYGQNHKISGFSVDTTGRYAGLFGKIAGGRVSGVQAEGDVTGSYEGSGSDVGVGGFAGKIDSKSLVDGCSFDGWVMNTATYNAGGFVGYTADSPAILRCCVHVSVENGSGWPNTGGFIGNHSGGFLMDCYAEAEVEAGGSCVGGFAGFVASSARIATSWCSGQVDASDTYRGAFVGQANGSGLITDSYYDTSANGQMEASGTSSPRGSAAYAGITPLDADDMTDKASFPAFDFIDTWIITEADGAPMLRTFFSAYDLWLKDAGIAYEPEPDELVNGIPAGARYVFGIAPSIGPADLSEPLIDIKFDTGGKPYVKLPAIVNTEGARVSVLATEDLADWTHATKYQVDPATGICAPDFDPVPPKMFFKCSIDVDNN